MVSCGTGLANAIIWVDRHAVEVGGLVSMMAWALMTSPSSTITLLGAISVTVQLHLIERPWLRCAGNADIPRAGRAASPPSEHGQNKTHRISWDRQGLVQEHTTEKRAKEGIGEPFGKAKSVEEFRGLFDAGIFGKTTNALQAEAEALERFDVPHGEEP